MNPFRFAADVRAFDTRQEFIDNVREIEDLGYASLLLSDHLVDQPAPFTTLGAAAAVTTTLRLGTFVLNNDLRHPAVLAQELATLDHLSNGRLEVGIGAGWNRPEYDSAGLTFDESGVRIDRLTEAVRVLKGLFADGSFAFDGRHYRIHGFEDLLRPIQRPHPPFLIGGGGPKLLAFAGREADIVGLAPRVIRPDQPDILGCTAAGTAQKVEIIKAAAGDRFGRLELNTYPAIGPVTITDAPKEAAHQIAERLHRRFGVQVSDDDILDSPHVFVGSVDGLVEKCQALRERLGISYIFVGRESREFAPVVARLAGT